MRQTDLSKSLGQVIRSRVDGNGQSITALGDRCGIPRATLYRKLDGHTDFTVSEIAKIAVFLGMPPAELVATASSHLAQAAAS